MDERSESAMALYDVFFGQWENGGYKARRNFEQRGLDALPQLLLGVILYIKGLSELRVSPAPNTKTPANQLMFGYLRPIFLVFSSWCSSGKTNAHQILTVLNSIINNTNYSSLRSVAILSIPHLFLQEDSRNIDSLKLALDQFKNDGNALIRASVLFAMDQIIFQEVVMNNSIPDLTLRQRMEEAAKLIIFGILSEEWPLSSVLD